MDAVLRHTRPRARRRDRQGADRRAGRSAGRGQRDQRTHRSAPPARAGIGFRPSCLDKWSPPLTPAGTLSFDSQAIREWARGNGYDIPVRGRIPAVVLQAWEQARGDC
ncbi:Lsr2 family DNA-binding protein [Streptomyces sp. NPDC001135]